MRLTAIVEGSIYVGHDSTERHVTKIIHADYLVYMSLHTLETRVTTVAQFARWARQKIDTMEPRP
jgi:hypothetical protein